MRDTTPVTGAIATTGSAGPARTVGTPVDPTLERIAAQRDALRLRHAQRLTALMESRSDLRGVHALADFVDDSVRWSA